MATFKSQLISAIQTAADDSDIAPIIAAIGTPGDTVEVVGTTLETGLAWTDGPTFQEIVWQGCAAVLVDPIVNPPSTRIIWPVM